MFGFVSLSQVFGFLLWIICWTDLFYTFHEIHQGESQPPIYFISPLVLGMTMVRIPEVMGLTYSSHLLRRGSSHLQLTFSSNPKPSIIGSFHFFLILLNYLAKV